MTYILKVNETSIAYYISSKVIIQLFAFLPQTASPHCMSVFVATAIICKLSNSILGSLYSFFSLSARLRHYDTDRMQMSYSKSS